MNRAEFSRLRKMVRLTAGESILDIGCAYKPNPYLRGKRVVGLDRDEMIVRPPYTEHVVGDVNEIDTLLPGQRFDTILLGEFIEHVERPCDLLRLLRGHIMPGGRLILSTPNPLGIPVVVVEYLGLRRFFYTPNHVFLLPPRWVWRILERSGYEVIQTVGCGANFLLFVFPAPAALSYQVIYVARPSQEP